MSVNERILKIDLHKFRKSRDYFPFDMTPNELAKYYPPSALNLTNGELQIKKAQEQNTHKRRRTIKEKSNVPFDSSPDKFEAHEWGGGREDEQERIIDTRTTNLESVLENEEESESEDELKIQANEITVPSQFDSITNTQESDSALQCLVDSRTEFTQPTKTEIDVGLPYTFQSNIAEETSTQEMDIEAGVQNERSVISTRTSGIISGVRDANISFLNASDIQKNSEGRDDAGHGNTEKLERDSTFLTSELNTDYDNTDLSVVS